MIETAGLYLVERFAEGAGATFGLPIIAALIVRRSALASATAAFLATFAVLAVLAAMTWQIKGVNLQVESYAVFGVIFPLVVWLFGTCVGAWRRNAQQADDSTKSLR